MHVHLNPPELPLFVANGVTTIRALGGTPPLLQRRDRILRGDELGPALIVAGPVVDGPPPPGYEGIIVSGGRRIPLTLEEGTREAEAQAAWEMRASLAPGRPPPDRLRLLTTVDSSCRVRGRSSTSPCSMNCGSSDASFAPPI